MPINIVRVQHEGDARWGILREGQIALLAGRYGSTCEFLERGREAARAVSRSVAGESLVSSDAVTFLAPITSPCRLICQGLNYRDHILETGGDPEKQDYNLLFRKGSSSLCAANSNIVRPAHVQLLDYELELGVVIGRAIRAGTEVTRGNLADFVAGIVITNDVSARDVQIPQGQWYKGKSYPTFCPVGPVLCLLEPEELHYLDEVNVELKVNGCVRQSSNTKQLIFAPAATLTELSTFTALDPGDVILTGTPGGVAIRAPSVWKRRVAGLFLNDRALMRAFVRGQLKNPAYLRVGDVVESRIWSADGVIDLGIQRNVVAGAG